MGWLIGRTENIKVDLLVEVDRTQKPAKNLRKFERYDAFFTGWGLLHPRVEQLGTRRSRSSPAPTSARCSRS